MSCSSLAMCLSSFRKEESYCGRFKSDKWNVQKVKSKPVGHPLSEWASMEGGISYYAGPWATSHLL